MAEPKKKSALLMAFGVPKDGKDGEEEPEDGDTPDGEEDPEYEQACDEMLMSIKAGDKKGFCEAFKAAFDILDSKEDEEEGEGEEPEEPRGAA